MDSVIDFIGDAAKVIYYMLLLWIFLGMLILPFALIKYLEC